jgi:cation diffusion facilitator CzcD-associated flavoprotein CzcO
LSTSLSRQYEFPFQPNYNWSRKYAPATEIWAYIKKVARDRGLTKFIRFNEEIVAARFTDGRWQIETAKSNTDFADVFICATGFLHKPLFPDIAGRESFTGASFHSARWDHSVPYAGKHWGVIGSGASGVQITEALAWAGCEVTQFIRRAQWVHLRENPHSTWRERLKLRLPGGYRREQRRLWQMINEGDSWRLKPGRQREATEREYKSYLDYVKDPELKKMLTPDYNLGCTRIPKSDKNYYEAVQLPNAHIVKGQITSVVPDGVVMADGTHVKLDVLVYATGFDAHAYMRPMKVTGLNGTTIDEAWKEKIYSSPRHAPAAPRSHRPSPRPRNSSPGSALPSPGPSGSAAARTGTPASSPRRSCGPFRRASTRRFSSRCRWTISSSFPACRETDHSSADVGYPSTPTNGYSSPADLPARRGEGLRRGKPVASCSRILAVYAATSGGLITGTRFAVRGGSNRRGLGAVK